MSSTSSLSIAYANTARTLDAVSKQRATGELSLVDREQRWLLYFFHGRLVYATGNLHRVRRWRRAIKWNCPDFRASHLPLGEPWEYQLLNQTITQNQLTIAQAQNVIKTSLEEVLFSWISDPALTVEWASVQKFSLGDNSALSLLVSSLDVDGVLQRSRQTWMHWKALELETLTPYRAPVLRTTTQGDSLGTSAIPANLIPFLRGNHTLWDIACYAKRPVTTVTRFLLPWVHRGAIAFEDVPDLPNTLKPSPLAPSFSAQTPRPLIACIDDSPTVAQVLTSILEPAGYRVLRIHDPLVGIASLSKYKPDLILLDLIMPNASGYDLCTFLRKTPIFQQTPIIILTSQNSFLDRTRAKLAGASDFLTKPPDPQALLTLIRTHLQPIVAAPNLPGWSEEGKEEGGRKG